MDYRLPQGKRTHNPQLSESLKSKLENTILQTGLCRSDGRMVVESALDRFARHYDTIYQRSQSDEHPDPSCKDILYANTLKQTLEVIHAFNTAGNKYVVIGGIAVLAHLASNADFEPLLWRGTDDLDVLVRKQDEPAVKGTLMGIGYSPATQTFGTLSPRGTTGFNAYIGNNHNVQTRPDVLINNNRIDITDDIFQKSEVHKLYGIGIRVPNFKTLIEIKSDAGRPKDQEDIATLNAAAKDPKRKEIYFINTGR